MKFRDVVLTVVALLFAIFAALNWSAFVEPQRLELGFGSIEAPLGLVMLGLVAALSALFLVYVVFQQASVILDMRGMAKESEARRKLAEDAELSRLTELKALIDTASQQQRAELDRVRNDLLTHLGEVEDKLDRVLAGRA